MQPQLLMGGVEYLDEATEGEASEKELPEKTGTGQEGRILGRYSLRYGLPMAAGAMARPPKPARTTMVRT